MATMTTSASEGDASTPVVHLVEDDESARVATARFLRAAGYVVRTYRSAADLLATVTGDTAGCVILDLRLPDANGLDLQRTLAAGEDPLPVIFLTGAGQVHDSVEAMKSGAVDFLMKTDEGAVLLNAVRQALARNASERTLRARRREIRGRYDTLSHREQEVFAHLISGELNKQIGHALGIAVGTTKIHRYRVMAKMGAASLTELARMADDLGIAPAAKPD
jgi:FixJ family two-component response regulator